MFVIHQRILYRLRLLDAWPSFFLCFLAGAISAFAFAPYHYWYVLPATLSLFYLLLLSAAGRKQAAARSCAFGYGYFMAGTYWIAYALAVDRDQFGWLIPISVLGLSAVMALWFVLLGLLVWWRRTGDALSDLLRFIVLWVAVEYLRTWGMFGFPWNLLGYAAMPSLAVAQWASLAGTYGLSLLIIAVALIPAVWLSPIGRRGKLVYSMVAVGAFAAICAYGAGRIPSQTAMTDARLRLVQPNIEQSMKWTNTGRLESIRIHGELSRELGSGPIPSTIIWSETALPFTLYPDSAWPARVAGILPPQSTLISGAVRAIDDANGFRVWNSLVLVDSNGRVREGYDKHQLVPFGEFVPLRHVLPLEKITPGSTDFSRGSGPLTVHEGNIPPFSPLICYEVIFPWIALDPADRPQWLLNVTNDAWYGDSPGPYQHFAISRMRAIEQGLPLVRVANTGISGVVDPYGRVVQFLPLGSRGIIDEFLPQPLAPTIYGKWGESVVFIALACLWSVTYWRLWGRKN